MRHFRLLSTCFPLFYPNHSSLFKKYDPFIVKLLFFFSLLFYSFESLQSQSKETLTFQLGEEEGLPAAQVIHGLEDSRGFIWLVSNNTGLSRWDGHRVKHYGAVKYGLPSNVQQVVEGPNGMLWVLSYLIGENKRTVHIFDPIRERTLPLDAFFEAPLDFDTEAIGSLQQNRDGSIWLSVEGSKIYEYDGKRLFLWTDYAPHPFRWFYKVNDNFFYAGLGKEAGRVYYLNRDVALLETHEVATVGGCFFIAWAAKTDSSASCLYVEGIEEGATVKSLYRIQAHAVPQRVDSVDDQRIKGYRGDGDFIYKSVGEEIWVYNLQLELKYRLKATEQAELLFADSKQGLWARMENGEVSRFYKVPPYFEQHSYPTKNVDWYTAVRGICTAPKGGFFMTQGGALIHVDKLGEQQYITYDKELSDHFGICLQRDNRTLWVSDGNKVWNVDPQGLRYRFVLNNEAAHLIWQPYEDRKGRILLGASRGLFVVKDSSIQGITNKATFEALRGTSIFAFYENEAGLWLCTSRGLFLLDEQDTILAHFHSEGRGDDFLPYDIIVHLHEDASGDFWLATKGGGLIRWNPQTKAQEQFTRQEGLLDNTLYAVYADGFGQLWLPSNNGLLCFDKKSKEIIYYLQEEGLPHLEFNTISHFQAADGSLYFGGLNGAIRFHPREIMRLREAPPIVLTAFQKQNREDEIYVEGAAALLKQHHIRLSPEDKAVQLSFALLEYHNSKQQRYAYKIEGYDKSWQKLEAPNIKINSLPYGSYTLRLRAQAAGSPWQEYPYPITIEVLRPFYLQAWFIALLLLLIIAIAAFIIRWRFSILSKRKEELEAIVQERTTEIAQQAEELKSLDRLKSRFFANISHELRTPLTLILGYTEDIQAKPKGFLEEATVRKKLAIMEQSGNNLLHLIEEILELSKLEANKVELHEKPTLLKPFIGNIFSSFESFAVFNKLRYRLDDTLPKDYLLYLDRPKVEKILNNLLSNAFKFTPAGEEVCLEVFEERDWLCFRVKDGGIGIHERDIPHIFNRFYQAKYSKTTALGGTGIGLALCKEFVQLLGGKIQASSNGKKGSSFLVKLPKKIATAMPTEQQMEKKLPQRKGIEAPKDDWKGSAQKKTVLCVEDNLDMQGFLMGLLQDSYRILRANNGLEGLKLLQEKQQKIDLVISDAMMPLLDGFTMLERIKADKNLRHIPIIMLTARAAEEDKLRALTIGVDDYLIKPFSRQELLVRIQNLLENYEKRRLWKQNLMRAAEDVHEQKLQSRKGEEQEQQEKPEEPDISQQDLLWMKEVEKELRKVLADEDFTIELLADKMFMSKRQLERRIKKITGLTPAKLVLEVRMQAARDYLEKAKFDSLSALSAAVGFKTTSYFAKRYCKRFGKKPADYFR